MASRLALIPQLALVVGLSGVLFLVGGWLAVRASVRGSTDPVPEVRGLSVSEARDRLEALGMIAEIDDDVLPVETMPANHVARQDPGPGTPVKRMRVVRLLLASGPRVLRLPTVVGDSRSRAVIALQQENFVIDYVAVAPSWEVERDRIIAQEPDPAELAPGATAPLRLLTSLGPPPVAYVMVNLVGRSVADVRPYLESLGFRVSEGPNRRVMQNVAPGTVVDQSPQPGFRISAGQEIILQVSR